MKDFLRLLKDHPKTTATGLAALATVAIAAAHNPQTLTDPATWTKVILSIAAILAADAK